MTQSQQQELLANFQSWSGGFDPESAEEVEQYIQFSLNKSLPEDESRDFLLSQIEGGAG